MCDRDNTKARKRAARSKMIDARMRARHDLPPAFQSIVDRNWQTLEREMETESVLAALACFNRYLWRQPVAAMEQEAEKRAQALLHAIRERGEGSEFFQTFCVNEEEEMRLRCHVFVELYEKAWASLSKRQRRIIRLAKRTGLSFARIAQHMGFASIAEVKNFYQTAWRAVTSMIQQLVRDELQQPGMEARRHTAVLAWHELFEHKTAAPVVGKLLASIPYFLALCWLTGIRVFGVT